jgi:NADPH:quinone reductase-like Zn-dependent oxidoreductase
MGSFIFRVTDEFMRGRAELLDLLATGALRPHVGATFGLDDVGDALRAVAARQTTGKVLITPS